jgi:hypothetical protein
VSTIASNVFLPMSIAVNTKNVYFGSENGLAFVRLAGGTAPKTINANLLTHAIVLDATNVYAGGTDGTVSFQPLLGGTSLTVATGPVAVDGIALAGGLIYFVTFDGYVFSVTTGGVLANVATGQPGPDAITTDGTYLYWANKGTSGANYVDGSIARALIAGGQPETIATAQISPNTIAVDASNVYWINGGTGNGTDGSVMMLAK